jgi:hypothetical protein
MKKLFNKFVVFLSLIILSSCTLPITTSSSSVSSRVSSSVISSYSSEVLPTSVDIDGRYTSKNEVALYIYTYHKLPVNFMTKNQAKEIGWSGSGRIPGWNNQNKYSIGGDIFYNREELLPIVSGLTYYECDIDYTGGNRGAKRIVFSSKWSVYYTSDHYASFTQLY